MTWTNVLVGLAIAVGLAGIVVPVLPGIVLIAGAILVWAITVKTTVGWVVLGVSLAILAIGTVLKYAIPGKQLKATVPTRTLVIGALVAVIGFFVIPVIGALLGFPLGVYLAEHARLGAAEAWPSTKAALRAIGVSILIEFVAGALAAGVWLAGVFAV